MAASERSGPLEDLTIIDCSMAYAGPFGTALLADMGANVVKVEPPRGDNFRAVPPFPPDHVHVHKGPSDSADYGMPFASVNRNKRSIVLDLKDPADKETLLVMCEQADAIVENMRAGVMDELGVGYDVINARNPKIVYGAVRGFGDPRTGESPYADWPCLDVAGQSFAGVVEATGDLFGVAISDIFPGTLMALGLVSAIHKAQRDGKGDFVDVAMYDGTLAMLTSNVSAYGLTGKNPTPGGSSLVPFGMFPVVDGRVAIAAPVEGHWGLLCEAMGRSELIEDDRTRSNLRRLKNKEFTLEQITLWTQDKTKQQILDAIGGRVPCGPANLMSEIFDDPHVEAREMIRTYKMRGDNPPGAVAGNPIKFANSPTQLYQAPPGLGEHTDELLAEFGVNREK